MTVALTTPISWKNASGDDAAMLDNLQPNILKPHTRDFMVALFLQFTDDVGARAFLRDVEGHMKSAREHLVEIEKFKEDPSVPGTPYVGVGLTAPGYHALGIAQVPSDPSFNAGMSKGDLHDPDVGEWDPHFRERESLHAVIVIGDMTIDPVFDLHAAILTKIRAANGVVLLGTQEGRGMHNANGEGIEHFGYVDGRSQPLFFTEDIDDEKLKSDGTSKWDAGFPLGQAIVPDPAAPNPNLHFGSYFVFRKLEQNVRKFKEEEANFAKRLETELGKVQTPPKQMRLDADAFERAGALLVGRFEDGTPATLQSAPGAHSPVPNDFDYESDKAGAKCPFFGHIRKTNPRGDGGFEKPEVERAHLMPRRGQTYGVRVDNPNDGQTNNKPTKDVGLLFMAFNSDIANQFEFMQDAWANSPGFPKGKGAGVDPIIGQTENDSPRPRVTCPVVWGDSGNKSMVTIDSIPRTVTMKGGEYFFMPSLAFLRTLAASQTPAPTTGALHPQTDA